MVMTNKLFLTPIKFTSVSREEFERIQKNAIKKWHFKKVRGGVVVPVSDEDVVNNNH